jgi:hypothetical protein
LVASLVGYFVYIVTAFVAVMGLLIGCFDHPTLEVRRYPSPVVEVVSASKAEDRYLQVMSGGEERFAKNLPGKQTKGGDVVGLAKPKPDKINQHKRLAHVEMPQAFARLHENYDERRFKFALGYADGSGYRPGLDGQR